MFSAVAYILKSNCINSVISNFNKKGSTKSLFCYEWREHTTLPPLLISFFTFNTVYSIVIIRHKKTPNLSYALSFRLQGESLRAAKSIVPGRLYLQYDAFRTLFVEPQYRKSRPYKYILISINKRKPAPCLMVGQA